MSDEGRISFEDCEELYDKVIAETDSSTDEIYLWRRLWKELVNRLGQSNN